MRSGELEPGDGGTAAVPADDPPGEGVGLDRPGDSQLIPRHANNAEGITTRACGPASGGAGSAPRPVTTGCWLTGHADAGDPSHDPSPREPVRRTRAAAGRGKQRSPLCSCRVLAERRQTRSCPSRGGPPAGRAFVGRYSPLLRKRTSRMSHSTTRRNRHSYMARPTRRTKQPILIPVAGNDLRPAAETAPASQTVERNAQGGPAQAA